MATEELVGGVAMTKTDELRRMLDERGVKWTNPNSCLRDEKTNWVANGFDYEALEDPYGTLILSAMHQDSLTPEQAVAATLGNGECKLEPIPSLFVTLNMLNEIGWGKCSECECATPEGSNYCQNCGRKVV